MGFSFSLMDRPTEQPAMKAGFDLEIILKLKRSAGLCLHSLFTLLPIKTPEL
jgi:hypothetical protein